MLIKVERSIDSVGTDKASHPTELKENDAYRKLKTGRGVRVNHIRSRVRGKQKVMLSKVCFEKKSKNPIMMLMGVVKNGRCSEI